MEPLGCSRRDFFALAGTIAAGSVLAACGSSPPPAPKTAPSGTTGTTALHHFRSRPDLTPPVVRVSGETGASANAAGDSILITAGGPMIVEPNGEPIWYRPVPHYSTNLRLQQYQGDAVLTWWQGVSAPYGVASSGACVILDSHYRQVAVVHAARGLQSDLHEFVIAPDGTAYFTAYQVVTADLSAIGGPSKAQMLEAWIQGIDIATQKLVFEWKATDHIALTDTYRTYSSPNQPFSPIHLNSIDPLPDGNLLVSARHTWAVYKIDRSTGAIIWQLGGKKSDFSLGTGVHFAWQHDVEWHRGNVLTMFDNESSPPEATQSRGLVLHVTEAAKSVAFLRAYYFPDEELLSGAQGSVQFLPNGDVFVGWGLQPYFTQYRHDGKVILKGHMEKFKSYRAYRVDWTGSPDERPAVAVERKGGGHLEVYASWNGATDVARWSVLGGSTRAVSKDLGGAARSGFETAIRVAVPQHVRFVAVRALDASGAVLATSRATKV